MRILVTGSREFTHPGVVAAYLQDAFDSLPLDDTGVTVVHGACPRGADLLADRFARERGWLVEPYPADWSLGKGAGHIRNQRMADLGADMCLAFFAEGAANRGTADCVARAEAAGIPVRRYPSPPLVIRATVEQILDGPDPKLTPLQVQYGLSGVVCARPGCGERNADRYGPQGSPFGPKCRAELMGGAA
jgi:hypothetical protein